MTDTQREVETSQAKVAELRGRVARAALAPNSTVKVEVTLRDQQRLIRILDIYQEILKCRL